MPDQTGMQKRAVTLQDGRYLIFFTFEPAGNRRPEGEGKSRVSETPQNAVKPKS